MRSLGVTLLLNEVAGPRASDLDAEAAWLLVRSRALAVAATATDAAIQDWALSFCEPVVACGFDVSSAAVGKSSQCALITAKSLAPGGESFSEPAPRPPHLGTPLPPPYDSPYLPPFILHQHGLRATALGASTTKGGYPARGSCAWALARSL